MRYRVVTILGATLLIASTIAFCFALTSLLDTGTCASGNTPYEISKPCPDGTGAKSWLLTLSILGVVLSGGTFALRGDSPGGDASDQRSFLVGWSVFFVTTGAVSLVHVLTSDIVPDDGKLGGTIVGAVFLLLGIPTLLYAAWEFFGSRSSSRG